MSGQLGPMTLQVKLSKSIYYVAGGGGLILSMGAGEIHFYTRVPTFLVRSCTIKIV